MDNDKQRQEISLIGRILSMEALLLLMGVVCLVYGIANSDVMSIFFSIIIIPGVFILAKVRKKDWAKHWQEMEAEHTRREAESRKTPPDSPPEG
jgi:hypothetical protein